MSWSNSSIKATIYESNHMKTYKGSLNKIISLQRKSLKCQMSWNDTNSNLKIIDCILHNNISSKHQASGWLAPYKIIVN